MRIGIQTTTLDKNGYGRWKEQAYQKLKEHGYNCSDFDMANTGTLFYTLPQEAADALFLQEKNLALEAGIEIRQMHGPWRFPPRDTSEEDRAERMKKMKYSIRACALLGCKYWVIHPIMPYGLSDVPAGNAQKTWDLNMVFMGELLKTAKQYGVTICLENMPFLEFSLSTPERILAFVNAIDDDHFQACLDTGHVSVFQELSIGDEVRRLGSALRVMHVHDNRESLDLHMMPFFGVTDWAAFAQALKEIHFDGVLSLETMPSPRLPDAVFEEMCKLLAQIAKAIANQAE